LHSAGRQNTQTQGLTHFAIANWTDNINFICVDLILNHPQLFRKRLLLGIYCSSINPAKDMGPTYRSKTTSLQREIIYMTPRQLQSIRQLTDWISELRMRSIIPSSQLHGDSCFLAIPTSIRVASQNVFDMLLNVPSKDTSPKASRNEKSNKKFDQSLSNNIFARPSGNPVLCVGDPASSIDSARSVRPVWKEGESYLLK
jgi:hypothetical protein